LRPPLHPGHLTECSPYQKWRLRGMNSSVNNTTTSGSSWVIEIMA
jgi:hypothetical protein